MFLGILLGLALGIAGTTVFFTFNPMLWTKTAERVNRLADRFLDLIGR